MLQSPDAPNATRSYRDERLYNHLINFSEEAEELARLLNLLLQGKSVRNLDERIMAHIRSHGELLKYLENHHPSDRLIPPEVLRAEYDRICKAASFRPHTDKYPAGMINDARLRSQECAQALARFIKS